mmetsp:Transcript_42350/g.72327  ORF Transcript_42350/g.72327 Transcript_42350/m.72327 type:complete len:172 (-) Transcript_42350:302-817(-)|eukprot:CAMPEP_0183729314 /NCGR_PEP_ID=MMETSP0737-20130205/30016_1 /TAXON_ID=385413 /ORGANISM="Thalassiosira miniscula, Strain CCMP1093" /LENGTH=171 /DNA_ID=CAMNT_0025961465 /DNA_START=278 /DNA_END=793 /DNA_ORIENTATION=+
MKRRQVLPAPSLSPAAIIGSSDIIPLPSSHIRRTPSEIQIADEARRAEHDDVRMYARLVVGMRSQIRRDYLVNGGVVHPLSERSLRNVVKTKRADSDDLEKSDSHDEWDFSFVEEQDPDADDASSFENAPWSMLTQRPPSKSESGDSLSTRGSMKEEDQEEEYVCVFSLEL